MSEKKVLFDQFLNNETVERVPSSFWYHFVSFANHYKALEDSNVKKTVYDGQKHAIEVMQPDFIKIMSDGFFGHPSVWANEIKNAADLKKIKAVGGDHPWIDEQIKYVKEIADFAGEDVYKFYNIFSPLQYIRLKFEEYDEDFSIFTRLFFEDTEALMAAANEIAKDIKVLVERLFKETKIDGIYYSVQSIQDKRVTPELFKKYVEPSDLSVLNVINENTDKVLLHICGYGDYTNRLTDYVDYPVSAFNWAIHSEGVSLAEGKEIFKGKPVFGGFDNSEGTLLYTGTEEELKDYVYKTLDATGTKGVAFGSDCTVSDTVPLKNLKLISEFGKTYVQENS